MKLPDFDHSKMAWDAWKAFHVEHDYKFVQFDTGEFVVDSAWWRPERRKVYPNLHIQIVATDDDACPRLYAPGDKPIPWSHLNHRGHQILLLDFDHRRAVRLYPYLTRDNTPLIPERFSMLVAAWYAGPSALPVGSPITRYYPQPLTQPQRAHIKELVDACKVWRQMQPGPPGPDRWRVKLKVADFVEMRFNMLTTDQRMAIALNGFDTIIKEEHPWLTF